MFEFFGIQFRKLLYIKHIAKNIMIERTIYSQIEHSFNLKPVTIITGARQVGKTTLCKKLSSEHNIPYVTLRDLNERELAIEDPGMFLNSHGTPLIIDEVQYAPELLEHIESIVDKKKFDDGSNNGMYVLTGSQAYRLMEGVTESMAGRVSIIEMSPLSLSEKLNREEIPFEIDKKKNFERSSEITIPVMDVAEMMVRGMYPETEVSTDLSTYEFYADYVDSYIERDVSQIINIRNKEKFHSFMQIAASLTGQELVYDSIAKNVGIDMKTCKAWMSVLVAGDIVHLLQPYAERSTVKRVIKRPKLYFCDTGLACHLAKIPDSKTLMASYLKGPMTETFIVNEILKTYRNRKIAPSLYYNRNSKNNKVDLIIIRNGLISLIECKAGQSFTTEDLEGFRTFRSNFGDGGKCIICLTEKPYPVTKDVYALPVTSI